MKIVAVPKPPPQRLLSEDQVASWPYRVMQLGLVLALLGTLGFLLSFLTRSTLTARGIAWKDVQTYALLVVFAGGLLFALPAAYFRIDLSGLSFDRLLAILRNEVYSPPDESVHLLKHLSSALGSLDDQWVLYSRVWLANASMLLPYVLVGPPGVFCLELNKADPKKRHYVDPAPALEKASSWLQSVVSVTVTPILLFPRSTSDYKNSRKRVKAFTMEEALVWLESRQPSLDEVARRNLDQLLRGYQLSHSS